MKRLGAGFTLVEVLVALSIFVVLGVGATTLLKQMGDTKAHIEQRASQFAKLQSTHLRITQDLKQLIWRPWRDELGQRREAVIGGFGKLVLHLTRAGWSNPLQRQRSDLQRVAYWLEDKKLYRLFLFQPDMAPKTKPVRQLLLEGVNRVDVEFIDRRGQILVYWPANEAATQDGEVEQKVLSAIRVKLDLTSLGKVEWLIPVAWKADFDDN